MDRLHQGDILRDIEILEGVTEEVDPDGGEHLRERKRTLPYVVVLTQDCDLEQDFNSRANDARLDEDKFLLSILVCPAYPAAQLRAGVHLGEGHVMSRINSDRWKPLKDNQNPRYHFLADEQSLQVPEVVLDFKQYFTIPRDQAYGLSQASHYVATANALFREDLCRRFADYLTRIALPEIVAGGSPPPNAEGAPVAAIR
ncbi:MAG: hypothetical protein ISP90_11225 [Nevskia sp.]|nr:hypothetical protein [Nevskia sp.]